MQQLVSLHTFLPVFKQAIARRGLPARLFVDNGPNFRSQQIALVCAKLSIALIHARPYQPAGSRARSLLSNPDALGLAGEVAILGGLDADERTLQRY